MRKLPLSWNWKKRATDWQLEELLETPHMVPTLAFPAREVSYSESNPQTKINDTILLLKAQEMGLPVIFRADNVMYNPATFSYFQQFSTNPLDYREHGWVVEKKTLSAEDLTGYFPDGLDAADLPIQIPGRNHYVTELHENGSATYLDTNTKQITGYGKIGLAWAYKLGYLYGTTDVIRNAAEVYPEPPIVLCADNDEAGNKWGHIDVRGPREFKNYADYVASFDGTSGQLGGRHPLSDDTTKQITAYVSAFNVNGIWRGNHASLASKMLYYEFNRGFRDGLATHNKHWSEVAGWMNYNQKGEEARIGVGSSIHINGWLDSMNVQNGKHKHGATGSVYFHPWYGQWNWARAIGCMSNTKPYVDMADLMGGGKPHITLMWENTGIQNFPRPDRTQWKSLVRSNMWINGVEYVGHWVSHGAPRDSDLVTIYWDEMKKCVEEVHNNEILSKFWQNGTIIRSIDCCPNFKQKASNLLYAYPWYLNYVEENGRYDGQQVTRPEALDTSTDAQEVRDALIAQGRYGDNWKRSLSNDPSHEVKVVSWTSRVDNELLLFAAGLTQDYTGVHIKVDVDNVVKTYVVDAPLGGAFYIIDETAGTVHLIDPRSDIGPVLVEPPVEPEPPVVEPEPPVVEPEPPVVEPEPPVVEPEPPVVEPEPPVVEPEPPVVEPEPPVVEPEPPVVEPEPPVVEPEPPVVEPEPPVVEPEPPVVEPEPPVVEPPNPPVDPQTPQQMIDEAQILLGELEGLVAEDLVDEVQVITTLINTIESEIFGSGI